MQLLFCLAFHPFNWAVKTGLRQLAPLSRDLEAKLVAKTGKSGYVTPVDVSAGEMRRVNAEKVALTLILSEPMIGVEYDKR